MASALTASFVGTRVNARTASGRVARRAVVTQAADRTLWLPGGYCQSKNHRLGGDGALSGPGTFGFMGSLFTCCCISGLSGLQASARPST